MKKVSRVLALSCCAVTVFMTACGGDESKGAGEAEIFSAYITDKILQDVAVEDGVKQPAKINIAAGKGEAEAAQIVMTAKSDIADYRFAVADLKNKNGDVLSAKNFEVFNQKYMEVKSSSSTGGGESGPLGMYPDILLPFEKAVEYDENTVKTGENQGIVVQATIPEDQAAGTYSGEFTLTIDGVAKSVPVTIEVYDVSYPEASYFDSLYMVERAELIYGEGDNSNEMYAKYCEKLMEYKTMPYLLPASSGDYAGYAACVKKYWNKLSGYSIPWAYSGDYVNKDVLQKYLDEIIALCLEDNINYLSKVRNYYPLIDEPLGQGKDALANKLSKQYYLDIKDIADNVIRAKKDGDSEKDALLESMAQSVENMKNIVTAHYDESLPEVKHFCPSFRGLDSEVDRQQYYDSNVDYWWYGCNQPVSPYPNLHTDDMNNHVATRVMGIMSETYGVQGELFWECVLYRETSFAGGYFHKINSDVYENAQQYPGTNGDGVLFYPGARYGIDGPLVSNRLLGVRDAHEDYDLKRMLSEAYEAAGYDDDSVMAMIGKYLYNGSRVQSDSEMLFNVRKQMFELLTLAQKEGVYVTDAGVTATGFAFNVQAADGKDVYFNGQKLTNKGSNGYRCEVVQTANSNAFSLTCGDSEFAFDLAGKKEAVYTAGETSALSVTAKAQGDTVTTVEGSTIGQIGKATKISFANVSVDENTKKKDYTFSLSSNNAFVSKKTKDFAIKFYNPTNERLTVSIRMTSATGISFAYREYFVNANGVTEISLGDLSIIDWGKHKKISSLDFTVSVGETSAFNEIYVLGVTKTEVK